jgi:hypothetical protein
VILLPVVGSALLLALVADVVLTVFPPLGHGGPVHRRLNRLLWSAFRVAGTGKGGRVRPRMLALGGPIMAVTGVALWGAWLVTGFALVYAPFLSSFATSVPRTGPGWIEAIYYSGYVASTLGLGDVIATTPGLRLVTVVEAVGGFALFAVATTYLLAISRELAEGSTLALELVTLRRRESEDAARPGEAAQDGTTQRWAEEAARSLLRVTHHHRQFPLLHYFRPTDPDRSLVVQVGWVGTRVDAWSSDGAGVAPPPSSSPGAPALRMLREALYRYLVELNRSCVPARFDPLLVPPSQAPARRLHARLLRYACYDPGPASWPASG